jgi:DNA-binding IclR family transcriptional regulator
VRINHAGVYAIAAMTHLANAPAGTIVSDTAICKVAKMRTRFVLQILRTLVVEGLGRQRPRTRWRLQTREAGLQNYALGDRRSD